MKITKIRFVRVKGTFHYDGPLSEERLARPMAYTVGKQRKCFHEAQD